MYTQKKDLIRIRTYKKGMNQRIRLQKCIFPTSRTLTYRTWCCRRSPRACPPVWAQRETVWCSLRHSRCSARVSQWTGWLEVELCYWSHQNGLTKHKSEHPGSSADLRENKTDRFATRGIWPKQNLTLYFLFLNGYFRFVWLRIVFNKQMLERLYQ